MKRKKFWKSMMCLMLAFVIGASGLFAGALPVYGESEAADVQVEESGLETATGTEEPPALESESGTESEGGPEAAAKPGTDVSSEDAQETASGQSIETVLGRTNEKESEEANLTSENIERISDEIELYEANAVSVPKETELAVTVAYPANIQCETPVMFTMNATGGSGQYQYRLASIMVNDGNELVSVYDTSYGKNLNFQDANTYSFTFYTSDLYEVRFQVRDKVTNKYTVSPKYYINIQDSKYPSVKQKVDDIVAQCLADGKSTDYEKALWLHDWIINNADYDYDDVSYCSAEGVLARGVGTCESYHRAYVMLLNKAGIQTGRIEGNGHVWTAVKMDGNWYQVDTTWDDMGSSFQGTYYEHLYFGLTDYIIGLVHSDHKTAVPGYESTALENNYFIKTGGIKRWSDPVANQISQKLNGGDKDFTLRVTDSMPDGIKNVIYNLVAYQLSEKENWNGVSVSVSYKDNQLTVKAGDTTDVPNALKIVPPSKTVYKVGETVNLSGLVVTAVYAGGTKVQVLNGNEYRVEGFHTNTAGTRTATVTYKGVSASFTYTVKEPPTNPAKPTDPAQPTNPVTPTVPDASVRYRTHVQSYGDQSWRQDGQMSGTSGESKRLEAIYIELVNPPMEGKIQYRTHIQSYGWEAGWKQNGQMSGTSGEAKRLEAIQIQLTGKMAECYDVYYRVHAQSYGWLGWAKNGASAGTAGYAKRLEGIEIRLVKKGAPAPGSSIGSFRQAGADAGINYRTHVQSYGWQDWMANGEMSGTSGQAKRLEGIEIKVDNLGISGGVQYKTHIQSYGWEKDWKQNGEMSGTSGQAKRLEAIQIQLTGELGRRYDVYYRVHAQSYGWLDWAKNGANAGTAGYAKRLEGIEIRLVEKGGPAPGPTGRPYVAK